MFSHLPPRPPFPALPHHERALRGHDESLGRARKGRARTCNPRLWRPVQLPIVLLSFSHPRLATPLRLTVPPHCPASLPRPAAPSHPTHPTSLPTRPRRYGKGPFSRRSRPSRLASFAGLSVGLSIIPAVPCLRAVQWAPALRSPASPSSRGSSRRSSLLARSRRRSRGRSPKSSLPTPATRRSCPQPIVIALVVPLSYLGLPSAYPRPTSARPVRRLPASAPPRSRSLPATPRPPQWA